MEFEANYFGMIRIGLAGSCDVLAMDFTHLLEFMKATGRTSTLPMSIESQAQMFFKAMTLDIASDMAVKDHKAFSGTFDGSPDGVALLIPPGYFVGFNARGESNGHGLRMPFLTKTVEAKAALTAISDANPSAGLKAVLGLYS